MRVNKIYQFNNCFKPTLSNTFVEIEITYKKHKITLAITSEVLPFLRSFSQ